MNVLIELIPDTFLYVAAVIGLIIWLKDGIIHPLRIGGNFLEVSAATNPKGQYGGLAVASITIGSSGHVGAWLATARTALNGWVSVGFNWAFGSTVAVGILLAVFIWVWIDIMVPGGMEPKGRWWEHIGLWAISVSLWPTLHAVPPAISTNFFLLAFIGQWVYNKKFRSGGGSRAGAMAGSGGGRNF